MEVSSSFRMNSASYKQSYRSFVPAQYHRQLRCNVVRASSENLLKKPELVKPELVKPERITEQPKRLFNEDAENTPIPSTAEALPSVSLNLSPAITIEYQRQQAKSMRSYFKELKQLEQISKATGFGWTPKNEISNGRWVMFGWAVGLLTEYATGVDFPHQLKLMVTYLGIFDLE